VFICYEFVAQHAVMQIVSLFCGVLYNRSALEIEGLQHMEAGGIWALHCCCAFIPCGQLYVIFCCWRLTVPLRPSPSYLYCQPTRRLAAAAVAVSLPLRDIYWLRLIYDIWRVCGALRLHFGAWLLAGMLSI